MYKSVDHQIIEGTQQPYQPYQLVPDMLGIRYGIRLQRWLFRRKVGKLGVAGGPGFPLGRLTQLIAAPELTLYMADLKTLGVFSADGLTMYSGTFNVASWPVNVRGLRFDFSADLAGLNSGTDSTACYLYANWQPYGYANNTVQANPQELGAYGAGSTFYIGGIAFKQNRFCPAAIGSISTHYFTQLSNPFEASVFMNCLKGEEVLMSYNGTPVGFNSFQLNSHTQLSLGNEPGVRAGYNLANKRIVGLRSVANRVFTVAPSITICPYLWPDG